MKFSPKSDPIPLRSWLILLLVFGVGLLNYFDRQTLSILKATLKTEIGLTDTHYPYLVTAFMVPYIVMYLVSGRIVDRFGSRGPMAIFVSIWSGATMLAGAAQNLWHLAGARALLGISEPGAFPAGMRAQVAWFPASRRAFMMSLISPCTAVGAILAPPAVALLTGLWGWRSAFIVPGVFGFGLAVTWWLVDHDAPSSSSAEAAKPAPPLRTILADRRFQGMLVARVLTDPVWYFYLFWLPGYLQERVGLTLPQLGAVGWIPSAFAAVAGIFTARWSDKAALLGTAATATRVRIIFAASMLAPIGCLLPIVPSLPWILAVLCIVYAVAQMWFFYTAVLLADVFPAGAVAGAMGVLGAVGATTAMLVNLGIGPLVERTGYAPVFIAAAVMHPLAAFVLRRSFTAKA
jgi:ACS family hexuronate transporter-like MFS transporter